MNHLFAADLQPFLAVAGAACVCAVAAAAYLWPTALLWLALAAFAISPPHLLPEGIAGVVTDGHKLVLLVALGANALRYGVRNMINWPIVALAAILILNLMLSDLHEQLTLFVMLAAFVSLSLVWIFPNVILEPGTRARYALLICLAPLLSLAVSLPLHAAGVHPMFDGELAGLFRLQGAANPSHLGLLGFAGFVVGLHEAFLTGRRSFLYIAFVDLSIVVLSGTRMPLFASFVALSCYLMLLDHRRPKLAYFRRDLFISAIIAGAVLIYYIPNLLERSFETLGTADLADASVNVSSRDEIWGFYWREFQLGPVLGRGLGSPPVAGVDGLPPALRSTHNEYLHILVVGGVVGFGLFIAAVGPWFAELLKRVGPPDRTFVVACIPALAVYAFSDDILTIRSGILLYAYLGCLLIKHRVEAGKAARPGMFLVGRRLLPRAAAATLAVAAVALGGVALLNATTNGPGLGGESCIAKIEQYAAADGGGGTGQATATAAVGSPELSNEDASPEAAEVYRYLLDLRGRGILAGQHNLPHSDGPMAYAEAVSGRRPAIHSWDWIFGGDIGRRQSIVERAIASWNDGALVEMSWHAVQPHHPDDAGWDDSVQTAMSGSKFREIVTPGTEMHVRWLEDVDQIAGYMKQLRDAGVVVLWRPYHEQTGCWFWWGCKGEDFKQLWRNLYERMTDYHGLDNLIWVWSTSGYDARERGRWDAHYPGDAYVDVVGVDVYGDEFLKHAEAYGCLKAFAAARGKPIALTENGAIPDPDGLRRYMPDFLWFLTWHRWIEEPHNAPDHVREVYNHDWVLTLDEIARP